MATPPLSEAVAASLCPADTSLVLGVLWSLEQAGFLIHGQRGDYQLAAAHRPIGSLEGYGKLN